MADRASGQRLSERYGEEIKRAFETDSGIEQKPFYGPEDVAPHLDERLGEPGKPPYTRSPYPDLYRTKMFTMRQIAGFGSAHDTNARYRYLFEQGQTGISTDFDHPTLIGLDSDHPLALHEVGKVGVAVDTVQDVIELFDGVPLDRVTVSLTINHPTPVLMGMLCLAAESQGLPWSVLNGTTQNEPLKEFYAQKTYVFPPRPALKLMTDTLEFGIKNLPQWKVLSVSGGHVRENGANAIQEMAFSLSDAITYVQCGLDRGLGIDDIARNVTFHHVIHMDFFEEIAKIRALRRMWTHIIRDRFGAGDPKNWRFRVHVQTGCENLTAQMPIVNVARTAIQALAGALAGVQSLHVNGMDEAYSIPSEEAMKVALRTSQLVAYETRATNVVDPLGGSYYVESLTDELENRAWALIKTIEDRGGMLASVEDGYISRLVADEAHRKQRQIETGQRLIVGVNKFVDEDVRHLEIFRASREMRERQLARLAAYRAARDRKALAKAVDGVREAAAKDENVMGPIIDALRAHATEGEVMGALKDVYGEYQPETAY
ncbi:MAG: methylmalonyl-CoA mutase [Chloroflexi bacterium]|nr:MAG: methylmalonyl-CoA mutase [Chloroflexota bacterium]